MLRSLSIIFLLSVSALTLSGCAVSKGGPSASLPLIVAHRGGTGDAPENTLEAIRQAVANRADALWLTVQLSRDGVPVLYRPASLSDLTNVSGPVSARTVAELATVNAGWQFKQVDAQGAITYPYRQTPVGIPTLREALLAIPANMPVILDMKALPALPQTQAVAGVLDELKAWPRVKVYSTEADYQQSFAVYPQAQMFEPRDATRTRLVKVLLNEGCIDAPAAGSAAAFELHRPLAVTEKFTLGEGRSEVRATLWNPATMACFRKNPDVQVMAIGVNNAEDYRMAACLGVNSVLADSPKNMVLVRQQMPLMLRCDK
ncbi:glycerophosphodiester phosphodiesterase family protein [Paraburkholderia bonniea]|uniref:glycerophosphodiester phosphodiesterase family protein n=1 Tax=Paraburkholderia bonniea TaxID=2152891 RepID=UPI0012916E8C|nr:glycerophosphodiester phosphodiesterase family protein [Paraburkholderia bonniea]WJF90239.1 glycerophosphodiester phosphodiesterase family protein [Paraburkholderia bonniea]WJF93553.1 glycerophosphodiester phosphodiesterase family protein [Paraburkholderia bonniea]